MSQSSSFDGEPSGTDVGTMEFPGVGEANFVFENKNLIYTEEYQMQNELRSQLEKESQTDTSATILWKHVVKGRKCGNAHGGSHVFKCKHCQKIYRGTYTRVYAHLMGHKKGESKGIGYCSVVKADKNLQQQIKREVEQVESSPNVFPLKKSKTSSCSVMASHEPSLSLSYTGSFDKVPPMQDRNDVDSKVVRCFCANGIPFTVLRSPYWEEMVSAISKKPYYKSPSCDRVHTILKNERNTIEREFDEFKKKWTQYGISIASNGWRKAKKQTLINFFASNQFGSMFLCALNFLVVEKAQKSVSHYILEAIENMGPNIVIQFIIDNTAICNSLGEDLGKAYPYIFWTPCMVYTLKSILKDTINSLPWLEKTYTMAKGIGNYIIYHSHAVEILKAYSHLAVITVANEVSASHCIILHLLLEVKESLISAVLSDQWEQWATLPNVDDKVRLTGADVKAVVMSENFWETVQLALSIIKPVYKMMRFSDQDGPIIGEVCEKMDNMLGEIEDNLKEREDIFTVVKEKVFNWWNNTTFPLQCLAYSLTPKYYDEEYLQIPDPCGKKRCPPDQDDDIFEGAMAAICKLHQNDEQADTVCVQFMSFIEKKGKFSSPTAKRDARNPKINAQQWWKFHGGDTKELRNMAFRVLAQSISTSSVERPWSTYSFIRTAKQNILNANYADDLLYIHSNLRLLSRSRPEYEQGPHRKWDINPDISPVNECALKCEKMHTLGLDHESSVSKKDSHFQNHIQEIFRIVDGVPPDNHQSSDQSQVTGHGGGYVERGGGRWSQSGASGGRDLKGKY